jgi:hypothetical protein
VEFRQISKERTGMHEVCKASKHAQALDQAVQGKEGYDLLKKKKEEEEKRQPINIRYEVDKERKDLYR